MRQIPCVPPDPTSKNVRTWNARNSYVSLWLLISFLFARVAFANGEGGVSSEIAPAQAWRHCEAGSFIVQFASESWVEIAGSPPSSASRFPHVLGPLLRCKIAPGQRPLRRQVHPDQAGILSRASWLSTLSYSHALRLQRYSSLTSLAPGWLRLFCQMQAICGCITVLRIFGRVIQRLCIPIND